MKMKKFLFDAIIFDLDGVITKTALVHAESWKKVFDAYLRSREEKHGAPFKEFDYENDYLPYLDGVPRYQGVKNFLESREINLPFGTPADPPEEETVCGLGNRKNGVFVEVLSETGSTVYQPAVDFILSLKKNGIRVGVASSSKNCELILKTAGVIDLFETRIDGVVSDKLGLSGKPEPDIFSTAATILGALPAKSVVVEDAISGVRAGRNGGFGLIIGVARKNNAEALCHNGADIVVPDMGLMTVDVIEKWFERKPRELFSSWDVKDQSLDSIYGGDTLLNPAYHKSGYRSIFNNKKIVFFLDYDGTLTPIVDRPELAVISKDMRSLLKKISEKYTIAIVSGRMREDVENLLGIEGLIFVGSHGFDIKGPGLSRVHPEAKEIIPLISLVTENLKQKLKGVPGVIIEEKKFSAAVHYRLAEEKVISGIKTLVEKIIFENPSLRLMYGKKVFELLPAIDWNKGKAIRWLMEAMGLSWENNSVIYIGDDVTDEDAFRMIRTRGTGIVVCEKDKTSTADFRMSSPSKVKELFEKILRDNYEKKRYL